MIALLIFAAATTSLAADGKAMLTQLKGDVQVTTASGKTTAAKDKMPVAAGDSVKTGAGAQAYIAFAGGHVVKVDQLSVVKVAEIGAKATKVDLASGRVFAKTAKLQSGAVFNVKTPTAVAGVRGTGFEATPASFSVSEGEISVSAGGVEVTLPEGMMTSVADGTPSAPEAVPADKMESLKSESSECSAIAESAGDISAASDDDESAEESGEEETDTSADAIDAAEDAIDEADIDDIVDEAGFLPGTGGVEGTIEFQIPQD